MRVSIISDGHLLKLTPFLCCEPPIQTTQRLIKESQFLLLFLLYQLLSCLGIDKWLLFIHIHYPLSITFIENHSAFTKISSFLIEAIFNSFFKRNVANIYSSKTMSYYCWLVMQSKLLNIQSHRNIYILEDFLPHILDRFKTVIRKISKFLTSGRDFISPQKRYLLYRFSIQQCLFLKIDIKLPIKIIDICCDPYWKSLQKPPLNWRHRLSTGLRNRILVTSYPSVLDMNGLKKSQKALQKESNTVR